MPWARPLRDVLAEEEGSARARTAALAEAELEHQKAIAEKGRDEHTEMRAQELQILKLARHDVIGALAAVAKLTPAVQVLADYVVREIQAGKIDDPAKAMRIIGQFVTTGSRCATMADTIIKLGRLDRGQSTENIAVAQIEAELTLEDALHVLEQGAELKALIDAERAERDTTH